jgi:hypothetical protein
MRGRRGRQLSATLFGILALACEGPTQPRSTQPPERFDPRAVLEQLAGSYSLTLNVSAQCPGIPDAVRQRSYRATLEQTRFGYLGVRVVGGGYSEPVGIGDLYPEPGGKVTLRWNDFDFGSCYDSYPEQVDGNTRLVVCGQGVGTQDGSMITGALGASAWIDQAGVRGTVCHGAHEFRFTRTE